MAWNWEAFAQDMISALPAIINAVQIVHSGKSGTEKFNAAVAAGVQVAANLGHVDPTSNAVQAVAGLTQVVYNDMVAQGALVQPPATPGATPPSGSGAPPAATRAPVVIPDAYAPPSPA